MESWTHALQEYEAEGKYGVTRDGVWQDWRDRWYFVPDYTKLANEQSLL
jgi:hypothetical protein